MDLHKTISGTQLRPYLKGDAHSPPSRLQAFIRQQLATWPELAEAHRLLEKRMTRTLHLPDSTITLQCNPERTRSTTAKVTARDVAKRPCFLCPENLYSGQLGLPFDSDWLILNNPFPIFRDHLVVSSTRHTPQLLAPALAVMISFVAEFDCSFSAFYNGARCGASAPDHLHFQACPAGMLPLERRLATLLDKPLYEESPWHFTTLDNRGIGMCRTAPTAQILRNLGSMCEHLKGSAGREDEADINLLVFGRKGQLAAVCLPRKAHRPACFSASGNEQYIISPGAVDIAGMVILPRPEDYERMTVATMLSIYGEVCQSCDVMTSCTA
jgi:hypothetical protein